MTILVASVATAVPVPPPLQWDFGYENKHVDYATHIKVATARIDGNALQPLGLVRRLALRFACARRRMAPTLQAQQDTAGERPHSIEPNAAQPGSFTMRHHTVLR
jgi:hypothetical protein